ncbi:YwbE family protein [Fluviicola sp.]|jgi:uncharacterized repeat protein (TIGR03833 family)|uniref:YwbE family protein n=1 Tax=Fluviicola sp. TaxID=1917219 RepID=UPI00282E2E83|nr:YwbE family protein [Fluviicola sp.]MDR0802645.1 YwbE family protein [Fluviicola sp.]
MKPTRKELKPGMLVLFVQKKHQSGGELTEGIIKSILTSAPSHPHGIKIMTVDKLVGRVVEIVDGEVD